MQSRVDYLNELWVGGWVAGDDCDGGPDELRPADEKEKKKEKKKKRNRTWTKKKSGGRKFHFHSGGGRKSTAQLAASHSLTQGNRDKRTEEME